MSERGQSNVFMCDQRAGDTATVLSPAFLDLSGTLLGELSTLYRPAEFLTSKQALISWPGSHREVLPMLYEECYKKIQKICTFLYPYVSVQVCGSVAVHVSVQLHVHLCACVCGPLKTTIMVNVG